jgi:hypothetical protein
MSSAAFGVAAIVLVIGCFLGWHANRTHAAHGDIRTTHNRISGYRKTRLRSGVMTIALVLIALLVVSALYRH